jgi:hypothetical protein
MAMFYARFTESATNKTIPAGLEPASLGDESPGSYGALRIVRAMVSICRWSLI